MAHANIFYNNQPVSQYVWINYKNISNIFQLEKDDTTFYNI